MYIIEINGDQTMLPQNMSLWHKDFFELKARPTGDTRGSPSPPRFCLKAGHQYPTVKVPLLPLPYQEEMTPITGERPRGLDSA